VIRAGIINVTGYVGAELARLLGGHPGVELVGATGRSQAGKRLVDVFPHLWSLDLPIEESLGVDIDVVVSALPHAAAAEALRPYIKAGTPVIDCSADFRLHDREDYERWYGEHPTPEVLQDAVYGLPELHRDAIRESKLVAVPGCYPTAAILGLAPLAAAGWLGGGAIVDAKSGVSGAGRALNLSSHFSEADENLSAYGLDGHRHQPEMVQELGALAGSTNGGDAGSARDTGPAVTFVPHLIPMVRGMLATCYPTITPGALPADRDQAIDALRTQYDSFYEAHPFAQVAGSPPSTKQTFGSNACLIYPSVDAITGQVTVLSALDNLGKGAAGAAVQCLNLMFGLDERAGLSAIGVYP
jgi:N-acetyl-gamma-glutamyl-phosphate reductase